MSDAASVPFERVRVLRIIARLNVGGPARHVALLTAGMDPNRFTSWLVTGTENPDEGSLCDYARARGVEPLVIPELLGQASLGLRDVIALCKLVRHTRWRASDPIGDRQRHTVTTLAQLDYRSVEMSNKTHGIECEEDFHFG